MQTDVGTFGESMSTANDSKHGNRCVKNWAKNWPVMWFITNSLIHFTIGKYLNFQRVGHWLTGTHQSTSPDSKKTTDFHFSFSFPCGGTPPFLLGAFSCFLVFMVTARQHHTSMMFDHYLWLLNIFLFLSDGRRRRHRHALSFGARDGHLTNPDLVCTERKFTPLEWINDDVNCARVFFSPIKRQKALILEPSTS